MLERFEQLLRKTNLQHLQKSEIIKQTCDVMPSVAYGKIDSF
jgi:hypothetical protein